MAKDNQKCGNKLCGDSVVGDAVDGHSWCVYHHPHRCTEQMSQQHSMRLTQCKRIGVVLEDGTITHARRWKCKIHCAAAVQRRAQRSDERYAYRRKHDPIQRAFQSAGLIGKLCDVVGVEEDKLLETVTRWSVERESS
jgi:hypothetical protein